MAKVDFSAILSLQVGSAPEPKPLPNGTYVGRIASLPSISDRQTKEGVKMIVSFAVDLAEPMDDVDQDELATAGGLLRSNGDAKQVRREVWIDPADKESRYPLDQLLAGFGYTAASKMDYTAVFEELPGREVIVAIERREYSKRDGTTGQTTDVKRMHANV